MSGAWCVRCGARFTEEELQDDVSACPSCGNGGVPCDPAQDVRVEVNWHELRILGIWAGNWADHVERSGQNDPRSDARQAVAAIARRLEAQRPDWGPLTMQGEIMRLKEAYPGAESNVPPSQPIPVNGPGAVGHCDESR